MSDHHTDGNMEDGPLSICYVPLGGTHVQTYVGLVAVCFIRAEEILTMMERMSEEQPGHQWAVALDDLLEPTQADASSKHTGSSKTEYVHKPSKYKILHNTRINRYGYL